MADSVEFSTFETSDGTIGIVRDNAARQSIANIREGKEAVGAVAWENVKDRPTNVSSFQNDKKYQTEEDVANTLNGTLYAGSSTHGGPATSADKLTTARTISLTGAASGSGSFDGSANSSINVQSLDATKLTGTVPITNLPPSVIERMSVVKDDTERFALTKDSVQNGDVVKVQSSNLMYYVVDDTKLSTEAGYEVFKAGSAASVPWGGVTGKPSTFPPSSHTHTKSQITDFPSSMPNPNNLTMQIEGNDAAAYNGGTAQTFNVTKSALGLDKVSNTADADKSVKYASSAGNADTATGHSLGLNIPSPSVEDQDKFLSAKGVWESITGKIVGTKVTSADTADSVPWSGVTGKPSTFAPSSHTHTKAQVGLGNVANLDQSKAIKSITRSGTTFTATALDGTTTTFTQQDNNTTYGLASQSSNGLMSAADKKAVDREFFRMLPKGGTVIPNGANLNSTAYLKVGNYYQPANVNTTNMTNIPFKAAFMMYVLSPLSEVYDNESTAQWVYRLRIFVEYTGSSIFTQNVSSGNTAGSFTYGPWVKMINSNDLGAVSNTINTHIANKANPHGVTKAQVGLGNVDNTADSAKSVKYAASAGTVNGHTVNSDVPTGAVFTDTTYTALKNPNALSITANGTTVKYDGSSAQSISISSGGSKSVASTLLASGWQGSAAPYTYDLGSTYSNKSVMIGYDGTKYSEDSMAAASDADIVGGEGTVIYAYGEKPTVDIPIIIQYS